MGHRVRVRVVRVQRLPSDKHRVHTLVIRLRSKTEDLKTVNATCTQPASPEAHDASFAVEGGELGTSVPVQLMHGRGELHIELRRERALFGHTIQTSVMIPLDQLQVPWNQEQEVPYVMEDGRTLWLLVLEAPSSGFTATDAHGISSNPQAVAFGDPNHNNNNNNNYGGSGEQHLNGGNQYPHHLLPQQEQILLQEERQHGGPQQPPSWGAAQIMLMADPSAARSGMVPGMGGYAGNHHQQQQQVYSPNPPTLSSGGGGGGDSMSRINSSSSLMGSGSGGLSRPGSTSTMVDGSLSRKGSAADGFGGFGGGAGGGGADGAEGGGGEGGAPAARTPWWNKFSNEYWETNQQRIDEAESSRHQQRMHQFAHALARSGNQVQPIIPNAVCNKCGDRVLDVGGARLHEKKPNYCCVCGVWYCVNCKSTCLMMDSKAHAAHATRRVVTGLKCISGCCGYEAAFVPETVLT